MGGHCFNINPSLLLLHYAYPAPGTRAPRRTLFPPPRFFFLPLPSTSSPSTHHPTSPQKKESTLFINSLFVSGGFISRCTLLVSLIENPSSCCYPHRFVSPPILGLKGLTYPLSTLLPLPLRQSSKWTGTNSLPRSTARSSGRRP